MSSAWQHPARAVELIQAVQVQGNPAEHAYALAGVIQPVAELIQAVHHQDSPAELAFALVGANWMILVSR